MNNETEEGCRLGKKIVGCGLLVVRSLKTKSYE